MKNIVFKFYRNIICIIFSILLFSCSSDEQVTNESNLDTSLNDLFKGSFVSVAHQTSGNVSIDENKTTLKFTNFMTDSGPNLDVYLVSDINNVNADFLDLGNLKGINGNYSYDLPANINYSDYKYVVIWCTDFSVNFGYATLLMQ